MPIKKYMPLIEHNTETVVVPIGGGRRTILKIENKAGVLKQVSLRFSTELGMRMIIKIDDDYEMKFPTGTQIITNHVMTSSYAPECIFAHKSGASPYGITSTYHVEFQDKLEIMMVNEGTSASSVTDAFLIADIFVDAYKDEKVWF